MPFPFDSSSVSTHGDVREGIADSASLRVYNVKHYGAVGDGTTNDTAAVIAARDAMIADRIIGGRAGDANAMIGILYFPPGEFKITSQNALYDSPTTGTAQHHSRVIIRGAGRRVTQLFFSSGQGATSDPRLGNLMLLANRMRGMIVENMSIRSDNANQSFCYMWCTVSQDGTYPLYGSGANNDFVWRNVELRGPWKRGWGFDGDANANLNSEQHWDRCAFTTDVTFADCAVRSGFSPFHAQQDQFLNYTFTECMFEYTSGDCLVFDRGGYVNVRGGSWIMGIGQTTAGGTWFKSKVNTYHADSVMHLHMQDVRFEARNALCQLIDVDWDSPASFIYFENCCYYTNTVADPGNHKIGTFKSMDANGRMANIKFMMCFLAGYFRFELPGNTGSTGGRISFEHCFNKQWSNQANGWTPAPIGNNFGALRYVTGIPKYELRNVWNFADVRN